MQLKKSHDKAFNHSSLKRVCTTVQVDSKSLQQVVYPHSTQLATITHIGNSLLHKYCLALLDLH